MSKKYFIPLALMLMLLLAACSGQPSTESSVSAAEAAGDGMDEMAAPEDEAMTMDSDNEMEAMGDDMDAGHDEDMATMEDGSGEVMDEDMDASHDEDMAEMEDGSGEAMDDTKMEAEDGAMDGEDANMDEAAEAMMDLPLWQTLAVTNAATGESFTLGDFQGQTVFVEPMATWCSNCRAQQFEVQQARSQLSDDVVFVGLSLETTLPAADLARYAQDNGFDWTYAVMSDELLAGLVDEFGRSITSAPSTPHFIIRPDGSFSMLSTGIDSAEEIVAQIQEAQG